MTNSCHRQYVCSFTGVSVRSTLEGSDDCWVERDRETPQSHVVEIWHWGSTHYQVETEARCEEPLNYGGELRAKKTEVFSLSPRPRKEAIPVSWKIEAGAEVAEGRLTRDVEAVARIKKKMNDRGIWVDCERDVPPDDSIRLSCRVR